MTDEEREAQIRHEIKARAPAIVTPDLLFLLRLLDEARDEIARLQSPPGASAMERAEKVMDGILDTAFHPDDYHHDLPAKHGPHSDIWQIALERYARALAKPSKEP